MKIAPTGRGDAQVHGRQATRGQDDNRWQASHPRGKQKASSTRGKWEASSAREAGKWKPHQGGGCSTGAYPKDPFKILTLIVEWKKDLDHILRSFYHYTYPSAPEGEWKKLETKFFNFLGQHIAEWKAIKEKRPLQFMPYLENRFQKLTGVELPGFGEYKGWINPGSYYHRVRAEKG